MNESEEKLESLRKHFIDELSKMSYMEASLAYHYAKTYIVYGVDVTETWLTAIENTEALQKAYYKGYHDAMQRYNESEVK